MIKRFAGFLCGITIVLGQAAPPAFEVATIKPNNSVDHRKMFGMMPGGRFSTSNVTLKELINFAYDLKDQQLSGGPGWVNTETFDIVAKPEGSPKPDQIKLMLQTLLADRFKLTMRRESKELSVYNLVVAKNGPKLTESKPDTSGPGGSPMRNMRMGRGQLEGQQMSMSMFAGVLSKFAGRTVLDKTGLTGSYDVKLEWTPEVGETQIGPPGDGPGGPGPASESSGPSLVTAIQEQLGLKLDAQKGPVEVFIIERVEKPTEN